MRVKKVVIGTSTDEGGQGRQGGRKRHGRTENGLRVIAEGVQGANE